MAVRPRRTAFQRSRIREWGGPRQRHRLREFYAQKVKPKLMADFGYRNAHEVPTLRKIVVNVGVGEAIKQPKVLDKVVEELSVITGQRHGAKAREAVDRQLRSAGRSGNRRGGHAAGRTDVGVPGPVHQCGDPAYPRLPRFVAALVRRAWELLDGLKEQLIFPEINYDMVEQVHGMDVTVVTNAKQDDRALALLRELGMPFRDADKGGRQIGA